MTQESTKQVPFWKDPKQLELIKKTVCQNCTDQEKEIFINACKQSGLNPLMGQIHAIMRYDAQLKKEVMKIQIGVDGYRLIAERTGRYSPGKASEFSYTKEGKLHSAKVYIKKMTNDGSWHEVCATAFFRENCQFKKDGTPTRIWFDKPHAMLEKCAESLAIRKAFPSDLAGSAPEEIGEPMEDEEKIDTSQVKALLEAINGDSDILKSVMQWGSIKSVKDLPKAKFETAMKTVELKNAEKG